MTRAGHGHSDGEAEPPLDMSASTATLAPALHSEPQAAPAPEKGLVGMSKLKKEISIQDQSSRMPLRKVLIVYVGVGLAIILSLMDQTSVSTAAPVIATDLGGSKTMSWIGTSFFVSNCALQLVYGRLSDIFGRKITMLSAISFLIVGNIACSFAQTPIQLYIFRAISGAGCGGMQNLSMTIISDIVPLKDRGKYQGLIGAAAATGNAVGPFLGGGMANGGKWRWLFRITAILGALVMGIIQVIVPLKPVTGSVKTKLKQIDYLGVFLSAAATVFLLVPISGGGSTFAWNSAVVIVLLILGFLLAIVFVLSQWRLAKLPILPLRLFQTRTSAIVMAQSFFIGAAMYGNVYYVPIFMQYVKGYSAFKSGSLVLAWTFPQSFWGVVSGFYISKTNHYKRVIVAGTIFWTIGVALQLLWGPSTSLGEMIGFLELNSIGIGFNLQTTLVAALSATENKDRSVVTASRNYFRTLGGAMGLAVSNAIYQTAVAKRLTSVPGLSAEQQASLLDAALADLSALAPDTLRAVRRAYSDSIKLVFASFIAFVAVCILLSIQIKEIRFREDPAELKAEKRRAKDISDADRAEAMVPGAGDEVDILSSTREDRLNSSASSTTVVDSNEKHEPGDEGAEMNVHDTTRKSIS